jgi:hypothetical protein
MRCEAGRWEPTWSEPRSKGVTPRIFVVSSLAFGNFAGRETPEEACAQRLLQSATWKTTDVDERFGSLLDQPTERALAP